MKILVFNAVMDAEPFLAHSRADTQNEKQVLPKVSASPIEPEILISSSSLQVERSPAKKSGYLRYSFIFNGTRAGIPGVHTSERRLPRSIDHSHPTRNRGAQ